MKFPEVSDRILGEISYILHQVDEEKIEALAEGIISSNRIFLVGMGRSGLVARAFAMRLMHMDFQAYIVGDATTPAIEKGDLFLAISGSGETHIVRHIASAAKGFGARVFLVTTRAESSIAALSDLAIVLPDPPQQILRLRSAFECSTLLCLDALVILIMEKKGVTQEEMMKRHSNLE